MNYSKPEFLKWGIHVDERGDLVYNINFDLSSVKRIYIIRHDDISIVKDCRDIIRNKSNLNVLRGVLYLPG